MPFLVVFEHKMDLVNIKRQQFLTPQMYETLKAETLNTIETFNVNRLCCTNLSLRAYSTI